MRNQPIGIFDSGVGGLSIASEVKKILPKESLVYLADQEFMPYGAKTKEELVGRVDRIMSFFEEKKVKAVVVACNTATIFTIEEMRRKYKFPIIGTVPVVKVIAQITKTGKTAILSTPATAKSTYLDDLITKYAPNLYIERVGGSNLEEFVENGDIESSKIQDALSGILYPLVRDGVDAIALGCTHYPFLKKVMQSIVGDKAKIVDSGGAVARRLRDVLSKESLLATEKVNNLYYTTGEEGMFSSVAKKLTGESIDAERITL